jgi:cytochrome c oxidase subunit 3
MKNKKIKFYQLYYIKNSKNIIQKRTTHPFHIVDPSPWPILTAFSIFYMVFGIVVFLNKGHLGLSLLILGLFLTVFFSSLWWRDVVREALMEGQHTLPVQRGLRLGMVLFIISEVMFFFSFFWAFFHSSVSPTFNIGGVWPPTAIAVMDYKKIPLLNTIILVSSGATLTWSHYALLYGSRKETISGMLCTIFLAIVFTGLQYFEYTNASFNISDSVYGSCFYITTGFHGFHVLIGTCFLIVCLIRLTLHHFSRTHHLGFETAAWYWHFVDVVWLFLYVCIYWWGGNPAI